MGHVFDDVGAFRVAWQMMEALPFAVLLVDDERRVHAMNEQAESLLAEDPVELPNRFGDAFHCINALSTEEGCGHTSECQTCGVKRTAERASSGERVLRHVAAWARRGPQGEQALELVLSAAPFELEGHKLAALTVEQVGPEREALRLLPICEVCGHVVDSAGALTALEGYLEAHPDLPRGRGRCRSCGEQAPA